jgi:hypothetical protein
MGMFAVQCNRIDDLAGLFSNEGRAARQGVVSAVVHAFAFQAVWSTGLTGLAWGLQLAIIPMRLQVATYDRGHRIADGIQTSYQARNARCPVFDYLVRPLRSLKTRNSKQALCRG